MKYAKPLISYAFTADTRYRIRDWEMRVMGEVICKECRDGGKARHFESDGIREPLTGYDGDIYIDKQGEFTREVAVIRGNGFLWSVFSSEIVE